MENLPVEILSEEIGKYLDLSGLIAISLVNKSFMNIFYHNVKVAILKIDPYSTGENIYDLLNMLRVGTLENVVFKIYKNVFQQILAEMQYVYPYVQRDKIVQTFVQVVPNDAMRDLKNKIKQWMIQQSSPQFFIYKNVVYRNYLKNEPLQIQINLETDLIDLIDPLLHELSEQYEIKTDDSSDISSATSNLDQNMDYFPYENILESMERFVNLL